MKQPIANLLSQLGWEDLPQRERKRRREEEASSNEAPPAAMPIEASMEEEEEGSSYNEDTEPGPATLDRIMERGPRKRRKPLMIGGI